MDITQFDEVQQFRIKLRTYLEKWVVPKLKASEDTEIIMDGNVFDALSVGPHFATNWFNVIWEIGVYARAILFYEFGIRTYPTLNTLGPEMKVEFPVKEPSGAPKMPKWDALPK